MSSLHKQRKSLSVSKQAVGRIFLLHLISGREAGQDRKLASAARLPVTHATPGSSYSHFIPSSESCKAAAAAPMLRDPHNGDFAHGAPSCASGQHPGEALQMPHSPQSKSSSSSLQVSFSSCHSLAFRLDDLNPTEEQKLCSRTAQGLQIRSEEPLCLSCFYWRGEHSPSALLPTPPLQHNMHSHIEGGRMGRGHAPSAERSEAQETNRQ